MPEGPEILFYFAGIMLIPVALYYWYGYSKGKRDEKEDIATLTAAQLLSDHQALIVSEHFLYGIWQNRSDLKNRKLIVRNEKDEHVTTIDLYHLQRTPYRQFEYEGKTYHVDNITSGKIYGLALKEADKSTYLYKCQNHMMRSYFYKGEWQNKTASNINFYGDNFKGLLSNSGHFFTMQSKPIAIIKFLDGETKGGGLLISADRQLDTLNQLFILCSRIQ